jgi:Tol biopolymer transport system component
MDHRAGDRHVSKLVRGRASYRYQSSRKGGGFYDLYERSVDGSGPETVLIESAENKMLTGRSRDDRFILYSVQFHQQTDRDLWALPLTGDRKPFPIVQTVFNENHAQISPDGKWIAYSSNEAGPESIRPFRAGRSWQSLDQRRHVAGVGP